MTSRERERETTVSFSLFIKGEASHAATTLPPNAVPK